MDDNFHTSPFLSSKSRYAIGTIIIFVFSLITVLAANQAGAAELSMRDALPKESFTAGWVIEEKVKLFDKDNLFDHINGEAELYFPYGFEALATANYVNQKNQEISLIADVYQMASLLDAFGIYSNYRKPNNKWIAIGAEGFISDSQLMFYQDRYFVRLQASGETNLPRAVFLSCAEAISGKLPAGSGQPQEIEAVKIPALLPKSERYLAQSLLGYAFFHRGMIADAVVQNEKMQIFAIREENPAAARQTFDQYYSYLQAEAKDVRLSNDQSRRQVSAADPLYGGVLVMQTGRYVAGVVRIKNNHLGKQIFEQLQNRIRVKAGS